MENQPMNAPLPEMQDMKKSSSYGGMIAIVLILALIVIGALYMWGRRIAHDNSQAATDPSSLASQGTSTDPNAIQADLNAQSSDSFNKNVDSAFTNLDASFDGK